jgi:hypothetical protein
MKCPWCRKDDCRHLVLDVDLYEPEVRAGLLFDLFEVSPRGRMRGVASSE